MAESFFKSFSESPSNTPDLHLITPTDLNHLMPDLSQTPLYENVRILSIFNTQESTFEDLKKVIHPSDHPLPPAADKCHTFWAPARSPVCHFVVSVYVCVCLQT